MSVVLTPEVEAMIRQRTDYRAAIYRALETLARHPEVGRSRGDRFPRRRSFQVEQHVIDFHQPRPDQIEVLCTHHQRQDASAAVKDPRAAQ